MKRLGLMGLMVVGGCLAGCKAQTDAQWKQSMEAARLAIEAARQSGLSAIAIVEHDGKVGVGQSTDFYLDSGFLLRVIVTGDLDRPAEQSCPAVELIDPKG